MRSRGSASRLERRRCASVAMPARSSRPRSSASNRCSRGASSIAPCDTSSPRCARCPCASTLLRKRHAKQLLLELIEPIAQVRGLLELEVASRVEHFALDALELALQALFRHRLVL